MVNKNPAGTEHHRTKSDHFFRSMEMVKDDADYRMSAALLAVHSAISLSDAIAVATTGKSGKLDDHKQASKALKRICGDVKVDNAGVQHLTWLLQHKSTIAYGELRLDKSFIESAVLKAQRFNAWAYNMFKEVLSVQD